MRKLQLVRAVVIRNRNVDLIDKLLAILRRCLDFRIWIDSEVAGLLNQIQSHSVIEQEVDSAIKVSIRLNDLNYVHFFTEFCTRHPERSLLATLLAAEATSRDDCEQ